MQRPPAVEYRNNKSHNIVRYCRGLAVVLLAWLGGCQGSADTVPPDTVPHDTVQRVSSVHIAALTIGPWEDFVDLLQPHFNMSATQAVDASLPITSAEQGFISKIFELSLRAGFSFGLKNLVTEKPISPDPQAKAPEKSSPGAALQMDPILKYETATALYQEVNLLDTYVKYAALKKGYIPYLVRLQVSVTAFRRDAPYDVYVNLGMFAACKTDFDHKTDLDQKWDEAPADVIPLLVTDDIEMQRTSDIYSAIRNLAGSIGLSLYGFGGQFGAGNSHANSRDDENNGRNSVHNVSQVEENTLQVRFGAPYGPNQENDDKGNPSKGPSYAMQTQTHDISFVMLVDPRHAYGESLRDGKVCGAVTAPKIKGAQIVVATSYELRSPKTGILLANEKEGFIDQKTKDVLNEFLSEDQKKQLESTEIKKLDSLLDDVDNQDETLFLTHLCEKINPFDSRNIISVYFSFFWLLATLSEMESKIYQNYMTYQNHVNECKNKYFPNVELMMTALAPISARSIFNEAFIDIPSPGIPAPLASAQTILIQDDCKTKAVVVIPGLNGLFLDRFNASLHLAGGIVVLADSITTGIDVANNSTGATPDKVTRHSEGTVFVVQFPSLGPLLKATSQAGACGRGFAAPGAAAIRLNNAELWLQEVSWGSQTDEDSKTRKPTCRGHLTRDPDPYFETSEKEKQDRCFPFKTIFYEKFPPPPDETKQPKKSD